jgi:chemotaxis protein methyltransferase CheR
MQAEVRPITQGEFARFRTLVEQETGIHLTEVKQALVNARLLKRIRDVGLHTFSDYYERVLQSPDDELVRMINAICTNETHFFREPGQFTLLATSIVPRWLEEAERGTRRRTVRVWSAACSSGEEPYSVAMLLLDRLPPDWSIEVLATDLSTHVLDKAMAAVYPMRRLNEIPLDFHQRFLLRGVASQQGKFRISQSVRRIIEFRRENLIESAASEFGHYDLVLCRNVLMYFHANTRRRVVDKLVGRLATDGYLCVGHSESLHGFEPRLATEIPTVYRLRDGSE